MGGSYEIWEALELLELLEGDAGLLLALTRPDLLIFLNFKIFRFTHPTVIPATVPARNATKKPSMKADILFTLVKNNSAGQVYVGDCIIQ